MTSIERLADWENGRLVSQKTHLVLVWLWAPFTQRKGKKWGLQSTDSWLRPACQALTPHQPTPAGSRPTPHDPFSFHTHRERIRGYSGGIRVVAQPGLPVLGLPVLPLGPSRQRHQEWDPAKYLQCRKRWSLWDGFWGQGLRTSGQRRPCPFEFLLPSELGRDLL